MILLQIDQNSSCHSNNLTDCNTEIFQPLHFFLYDQVFKYRHSQGGNSCHQKRHTVFESGPGSHIGTDICAAQTDKHGDGGISAKARSAAVIFLFFFLLFLTGVLIPAGCASGGKKSKSGEKGDQRDQSAQVLQTEASGEVTYGNDLVVLDASHTADGYVMICYN